MSASSGKVYLSTDFAVTRIGTLASRQSEYSSYSEFRVGLRIEITEYRQIE